MEKRKKLQAKIVSASNDKFVIRIGDISKTPKFGDSLVVTIPSRAKVEMVRKTNSLSGVRITDTIARGKVIGVNEGVVTVNRWFRGLMWLNCRVLHQQTRWSE